MRNRKQVGLLLLCAGLVLSLALIGAAALPAAAQQPDAPAPPDANLPAVQQEGAATPDLAPLDPAGADALAYLAAADPATLSTPLLIEQAYVRGEITEVERVLYLAYALYEPASLPPQFQSNVGWRGTQYVLEVQNALPALQAAAPDAMQQELGRLSLLAATVCDEEDNANSSDSTNFHFNYGTISGGLTLDSYSASLEQTFAVEVTSFGWAKPPLCTGGATCGGVANPFGRYPVQIAPLGNSLYGYVSGGGEYTGFIEDNPNTPAVETAAFASCMVLNDDYSSFFEGAQAALDATTAHEFVHSIQFGYGDPNPSEDDMWYESSASAMEDEVFDSSNSNYLYLWPVVSNSLGEWPNGSAPSGLSQYSNFLFFRHMAEHNGGANTPGGGEDVLQRFWENVAAGQGQLTAYNNALATKGANLADAFHHYAVAAGFSKGCGGGYVAPYCFEEGAAYVAAAGGLAAVQGSIATSPGSYNGSIRNHYAANWINLPTSGSPYKVTLTNTAAGGQMRGSLVCDTGTALAITAFPAVVSGGAATSIDSFSTAGCTRVTAVLTNQEQTSANPGSAPLQNYTLALSAAGPTATPTSTPTATSTPTVTPTPTPAPPRLRADTAVTLKGTPVVIDVLANDRPGTNPNIALTNVTQPISGSAAIEQARVRFIPEAAFTGNTFFTYTVGDGGGLSSSARVAVVVSAPSAAAGTPRVLSVPDPSVTATLTTTTSSGGIRFVLPAGAAPNANAIDLIFTEVITPVQPLTEAIDAGIAFRLEVFVDAQPRPGYVFAQPILITLPYDPAQFPDPSRLALFYYDAAAGRWSDDGIRIVSADPQARTFTASVAHLSEFAAGVRPRPLNSLNLPVLKK